MFYVLYLIRKKRAKKWFIAAGVSLVLWLVLVFISPCNHEWTPATCTEPKICTKCGLTEGEPLGHTAGEVEAYTDYVSAKLVTTTKCKVCGEELSRHENNMSKFYYNNQFTFTPSNFTLRFYAMLNDIQGCNLTAECVATKNYIMCNIDDYGDSVGYIAFSDGGSLFSPNQKDDDGIKTIMLSFNSSEQNLVYVVHALIRTCDPSLDFDEAKSLS